MENGKVAVVPGNLVGGVGFGSTELVVLRPEDGIEPRWLSRYLSQATFRRRAKRAMTGAVGQQRVPKDFIEAESLPVAPPPEQQRIADVIDELFSDLDAGVRALERVKRNLERYRASILTAAVEGRLTADWRKTHPDVEPASELLKRILKERRKRWEEAQLAKHTARGKTPPKGWETKYKEPAPPDTSELPALPKGWCWATIDQVLSDGSYGTSVRCSYEVQGVPVLRIPNIVAGEIDLRDLKYSTKDLGDMGAKALVWGDILVCRTNGSLDLVGKAAVVHADLERPHYFASYLIRLRLIIPDISAYVHVAMRSTFGRKYIQRHAASSAGQHNISLSSLRHFLLPLPPLEEQTALFAQVDDAQSMIQDTERSNARVILRGAGLRRAILKRAFEGRLLPQDPNDEPANRLLDRIRAARAVAAKEPRRRQNAS
jgi:type I restriction enzyme S subunit